MNNKIWIIARKDIGEAFRSRSTYVFIIIMLIITISYVSSYSAHVRVLNSQQAIVEYSHEFLTGLAYVLPMMYSILVCSVFTNYTVIVDKAKRNIESLMATPVSVKQIWLGKALAVTLPSIMIGILVSILIYLAVNIGLVVPKAGEFIFPEAMSIFSALILVPVLVFSIVSIVTYVQLVITNPRIANFVFTGIFLLLFFGINILGGLGISVTYFFLIYLGVIAVCGLIAYFLSLSLTKEKVLLSSKM